MIARLSSPQVKFRFEESRALLWAPALAVILGLALAVATPAGASLSVAPVTHEIVSALRQRHECTWRVRNTATEAVVVRVSVIGYEDYMDGNRDAAGPSWLVAGPEEFILGPGEETGVRGVVQVTDTMMAGERMAWVFFADLPLSGAPTVQGRIGTSLYLMMAGTLEPRLELETCTPLPREDGRWQFLAVVRNTGNVHLRPGGEFTVLDAFGSVVERAPVIGGMPVLPGAETRYGCRPLSRPLAPGAYTVRCRIDAGGIDGRVVAPLVREASFTVPSSTP